MDRLIQYSIPVKGIRSGTHQFDFQIDRAFFQAFEDSPVSDGSIALTLLFDKRPDMYVLKFDFAGTLKTECDRCLAVIDLPVSDQQQLIVKLSEAEQIEDADVVYIHPETQQLNVAVYIYEYIILSMPFMRVYDCENDDKRVCNEEMLRYLNGQNGADEVAETPEVSEQNELWEALKKLNIRDN